MEKTIVGDTIFYDKIKNYGESFGNVEMVDSVKKTRCMATMFIITKTPKQALPAIRHFWLIGREKTLCGVHADTLRTFKDSIYDVAKGYLNVRMYRNDIQGFVWLACIHLARFGNEYVWWACTLGPKNQLSGEFIQAFTKTKK